MAAAAGTPRARCFGAEWSALGSGVVLRVSVPGALAAARAAVEHELDAVDRACSRFRADSELSRLNARAGSWQPVGRTLLDAVGVALRAAVLTDGDVDPTLGGALELAGYDRDWRLLEPDRGLAPPPVINIRRRSGHGTVEIDERASAIRIPAGVALDLGATAKAWAADRACAAAAAAGSCGALVSLGGDISTAGPAPSGGWLIRVTDDHRAGPSAAGQTVAIESGGLATSSTAARRWTHAGHAMHHIIDPRSGAPASSRWRTASVAAATCTDANIAATAALIRSTAAVDWLEALALPARLVDHAGAVTPVAGWPADSETGALAA